MRVGYALYHGKGRGRLQAIHLDADALWFQAWEAVAVGVRPIKISDPAREFLRSHGYEVRPIGFQRCISKRPSNSPS